MSDEEVEEPIANDSDIQKTVSYPIKVIYCAGKIYFTD